MSEDAEIKGVIPNYYNLIIDKLNKIYEAWDNNNQTLALTRAMRLIPFLPRKIKKQIIQDKDNIQKQFDAISGTKGYNLSNAAELANYRIKMIAVKEVEPFINKLTDLLDQEHLLTQSYGIPTKARGMGDIQKTVDIARHDSGAE